MSDVNETVVRMNYDEIMSLIDDQEILHKLMTGHGMLPVDPDTGFPRRPVDMPPIPPPRTVSP